MTLVAHPHRNNVWVKPELIRQQWLRNEPGVGFPATGFAWNAADGSGPQDGHHEFEQVVVSVSKDTRSAKVPVGSSI